MRQLRSSRAGLSLVEVLIVIAIIAVLMSLLLPAVLKVREAANRTTCANNLFQLGKTFQMYHDARGRFPPGGIGYNPAGVDPNSIPGGVEKHGPSWLALLLPFTDQASAARNLPFGNPNADWRGQQLPTPALQAQLQALRVPIYNCPSSPMPRLDTLYLNEQMVNYVAIGGSPLNPVTGIQDYPEGIGGTDADNGVLYANGKVKIGDITDGIGTTMMVGEQSYWRIDPTTGARSDHRSCAYLGVSWNGCATNRVPSRTEFLTTFDWCLNITYVRYPINYNVFGPGFSSTYDKSMNRPLTTAHPGVAQTLFADGHVQGIETNIKLLTLVQLAIRNDGLVIPDF
jgi:prepilin-type N-terminal cleavage/methylation domain-containing protein/prepilin-type processing-associated H-X9-DG protein